MLRLAVPKGSLEEGTFKLFQQADLPIKRAGGDRSYSLKIEDPRIDEVFMLRPQEIPPYINEGEFDLGVTGLDWVVETGSAVQPVADLAFSRQGWKTVKIVLATDVSNPVDNPEDIPLDSRVITEYPRITRRFLRGLGKAKVSIRGSFGATESKVPRLAEYLVDVTETGETLRKNNKKILAVLLESSTKLIANQQSWANPEKRRAIEEVASLLTGVLLARDKVLIKMVIQRSRLQGLLENIPSIRPPAISQLFSLDQQNDLVMVETVVEKAVLSRVLPLAKAMGATDILEVDISKMMP